MSCILTRSLSRFDERRPREATVDGRHGRS